MRALGERDSYGRYGDRLAKFVHSDFHTRLFLASGGGGRFDLERTTDRGDVFPAGPEGASSITVGKWQQRSQLYPRPLLMDQMEARTAAIPEIRRVLDAWRRLRDWEPNGEVLYRVVLVDCVALPPDLHQSAGWRHHDKRYGRQRDQAWEIIAVLVVEPAVLAAAEAAGAVDAKALAWARARGLR